MLGKTEGKRRWGQQRMRWLDGITDSMDMIEQALRAGDGQGSLLCCSPWGFRELDTTEQLNNSNCFCGYMGMHINLNSMNCTVIMGSFKCMSITSQ